MFCQVSEPALSWGKYKDSFSEDILWQVHTEFPDINIKVREMIYNNILILLEDVQLSLEGQCWMHFGFAEPKYSEQIIVNQDYLWDISYDVDALLKWLRTM